MRTRSFIFAVIAACGIGLPCAAADVYVIANDSLRMTLAELRESFEASDLPITIDVVDWGACTEQFRSIVAPQLVRVV